MTTTTSSSVAQNNNMQLVDDTPFANIADPPTDVDFLGKIYPNILLYIKSRAVF